MYRLPGGGPISLSREMGERATQGGPWGTRRPKAPVAKCCPCFRRTGEGCSGSMQSQQPKGQVLFPTVRSGCLVPHARQWSPPRQRGHLPAPCASLALQGASGGAAFGGVACGPGGWPFGAGSVPPAEPLRGMACGPSPGPRAWWGVFGGLPLRGILGGRLRVRY